MLIPKLLGLLWELGAADGLGAKAIVDRNLEIAASEFRKGGIALSVWTPGTKVFSIHLADDPSSVDPRYFRYQSGRCSILSWDRGSWEDRIIALPAVSREITQTFISGLALRCALR